MKIDGQIISYQEVVDGVEVERDNYKIAVYALASPRKDALLCNPFTTSMARPMLYLQKVEGVVAGRMMFFSSRFYNGLEIIESCGASSLEVHEKYKDLNIGADLAMFPVFQMNNKILIYADFSGEGLAACRALKFKIFTMPKYLYFIHSASLFESIGIKGIIGKILSRTTDRLLSLYRHALDFFEFSARDYVIEKVSVVPEWVDDIVLKDGHKYMEVHDHNWFQWNLDNMFHSHDKNKNEFYIIKKNGENVGFFMTKTRFADKSKKGLSSIIFGGIMEWGTKNTSVLLEYQIYKLALSTFKSDVDFVAMAIQDADVQKKMKKHFILRRGDHSIAFKDVKKQYKDAANQELWRLRYGYGDSILN